MNDHICAECGAVHPDGAPPHDGRQHVGPWGRWHVVTGGRQQPKYAGDRVGQADYGITPPLRVGRRR